MSNILCIIITIQAFSKRDCLIKNAIILNQTLKQIYARARKKRSYNIVKIHPCV